MRYNNTSILRTEEGKQYLSGTFYPLINPKESDIYVITVQGDRLDLLAFEYYKDSTLWWVIASANSINNGSMFPTPGTQLRIPMDLPSFMNEFNQINKNK